SVQQATSTLQDRGFTVTVRNRNVPGGNGEVIDQVPAPDTEADRGSQVLLEVAVPLTPPVLLAPPNGASFAESQGNQTVQWAPVAGAALYDVRITGTCLIRIPGFCNDTRITDTIAETFFVV